MLYEVITQLSVDDFGDANTSSIPNSGVVSLDDSGRIKIEKAEIYRLFDFERPVV